MHYGILTAFTLIAFAANSLLCRIALGAGMIDPVSFSTLRLAGGALILLPVSRLVGGSSHSVWMAGSWRSSAALFAYALAFATAYVWLETGIGALILFGAVQATMIGMGIRSGEQVNSLQWLGLVVALGGLVYLVSPGIAAPPLLGALLMCAAGVAWGLYSLRGRRTAPGPVFSTTANFVFALPLAAAASALSLSFAHLEATGIFLALLSGSITSGLGYVLWYKALHGLTSTQAAVVQLLVPILAAVGGVVFLAERPSVRLAIAATLILGGVAMAVFSRASRAQAARCALPTDN